MKKLLGPKLHFDWKIVTITIASTLLLMVDHYHRMTPYKYLGPRHSLSLYSPGLHPFIFRENPRDYGLTLGDWKAGLVITAAGILLMAPVIWYLGKSDPSHDGLLQTACGRPALDNLPRSDRVGVFLSRLDLVRLCPQVWSGSLWLQAVPFALAHIGKPEVETLSTIFGGFAFGWVAWRTRSFLYPFLIHWFIATFIILVAAGVVG